MLHDGLCDKLMPRVFLATVKPMTDKRMTDKTIKLADKNWTTKNRLILSANLIGDKFSIRISPLKLADVIISTERKLWVYNKEVWKLFGKNKLHRLSSDSKRGQYTDMDQITFRRIELTFIHNGSR